MPIKIITAALLTLSLCLFSVLTACSVEPDEGQLKCSNNSECPPEWFCDTDSFCYSGDTDSMADNQ